MRTASALRERPTRNSGQRSTSGGTKEKESSPWGVGIDMLAWTHQSSKCLSGVVAVELTNVANNVAFSSSLFCEQPLRRPLSTGWGHRGRGVEASADEIRSRRHTCTQPQRERRRTSGVLPAAADTRLLVLACVSDERMLLPIAPCTPDGCVLGSAACVWEGEVRLRWVTPGADLTVCGWVECEGQLCVTRTTNSGLGVDAVPPNTAP
jgi:hypothetical protein